jgi:hypothetical protein
MEVYRDSTTAQIVLNAPPFVVPEDDTVDVKVVRNGEIIYTFEEVYRLSTGFAVTLPWSLVREDNEFFIDWYLDYREGGAVKSIADRIQVSVITPILPLTDVRRISGFDDDEDIRDLERKVRYTIQSYTGQNFGRYKTSMKVYNDEPHSLLSLPTPLLEVESISGTNSIVYPGDVNIYEEGWALAFNRNAWYDVKSDVIEFSGGNIVAPSINGRGFFGRFVTVTGTWGFYNVPDEVQEAARILVADYSCDESLWRERYLTSIRAADWRFDFSADAMTGTGNVVADQLLSEYRKKSMAVI